jgi:hypothetical protein
MALILSVRGVPRRRRVLNAWAETGTWTDIGSARTASFCPRR